MGINLDQRLVLIPGLLEAESLPSGSGAKFQ